MYKKQLKEERDMSCKFVNNRHKVKMRKAKMKCEIRPQRSLR